MVTNQQKNEDEKGFSFMQKLKPFHQQSFAVFILFFVGGTFIYAVTYVAVLKILGVYEPVMLEARNEIPYLNYRQFAVGIATAALCAYMIAGILYAKGGPFLNIIFGLIGGFFLHLPVDTYLAQPKFSNPTISYPGGSLIDPRTLFLVYTPGFIVLLAARFFIKRWVKQNTQQALSWEDRYMPYKYIESEFNISKNSDKQ